MLHAVKKVEYIKDYKLRLTFRNKTIKIVDLENELWGPMFEPLKDTSYFKLVKTDGHTIVWPNDVDFCPDVLYEIGLDAQEKKKPKKSTSMSLNKNARSYQAVSAAKRISKKSKK